MFVDIFEENRKEEESTREKRTEDDHLIFINL